MDTIHNGYTPLSNNISSPVKMSLRKSALHEMLENQHWENFKKQMLSMYESQTLCDVWITVDNISVLCHRAILAAGSSYFYAMFNSNMIESNRGQQDIKLSGIDPCCLKAIIDFLYTGKLDVNEENSQGLLEAAEMLLLDPVREIVGQFYTDNLTLDNCLGLWTLSDQFNNKVLSSAACDFTANNFSKVCESEEFLKLDASKVQMLLRHPGLEAASEDAICMAGLKWMNKDPELRAPQLITVLSGINFLDLTIDFIRFYAMELPTLQREKVLMQRFRDVLDYLQLNIRVPKWLELHPTRTNLQTRTSIVLLCKNSSDIATVCQTEGKYSVNKLHVYNKPYKGSHNDEYYSDSDNGEDYINFDQGAVEACVLDNLLYVFGPSGKQLWCYNCIQHQWSSCADALKERSRCAFVSGINRKLYVLGGTWGFGALSSIEEYDAKLNKWKMVGDLQIAVYDLSACFYAGSVYGLGGLRGESVERNENRIQQFNTFTKVTCILVPTLPIVGRLWMSLVIRDMLVVFESDLVHVIEMAALCNGNAVVQWKTKIIANHPNTCVTVYGDKLVKIYANSDGSLDHSDSCHCEDNRGILEASIYQLLDPTISELEWKKVGRLPWSMVPEVAAVLKM